MRPRAVLGCLLAVVALAAPSASAHPDPSGCTQPAFSYAWGGLGTFRNGDTAHLTGSVGNNNPTNVACNITDATITLQVPAADGSDGQTFVLATDVDLQAGDAPVQFGGTIDYDVDFNPGVFRGWVNIAVNGTVHSAFEHTGFLGSGGSPLKITRPRVALNVAPVINSTDPLNVTYTYTAVNNSPQDPEPGAFQPAPFNTEITDDKCASPAFAGGDTNASSTLDLGEEWTWTCTTDLAVLHGSTVNTATFTGVSNADGRPWPVARARAGICDGQVATVVGTASRNRITGTSSRDVIATGGGNDVVNARSGKDLVCGGSGDDVLRGEGGDDTLRGEGGNDELVGGSGADQLIGGPGRDTTIQ